MKIKLALIFSIISWSAVILQFFLMLQSSDHSFVETTVRFFSFFTILTNSLVAFYFSTQLFMANRFSFWNRPGVLTAITVYIIVVGVVYQIVLRPIWDPQGLAKVVDELLHSLNPLMVLFYWWLYEKKSKVTMSQVPYFLVYPFIYLVYILIRGHYSGFYPYPFVNVSDLGCAKVAMNSFYLFLVFTTLSTAFVFLGKRYSKI